MKPASTSTPSSFAPSAASAAGPAAGGAFIQSLGRGLRILELVGARPEGVSLGGLAASLGLGKPTVHNLARTLVTTGYLVQRPSPARYLLGPALFALAGNEQRRPSLRDRAAVEIAALVADFPGTIVLLAEPAGAEIRVTVRATPGGAGVERPENRFLAPYGSATSLLFLAYWEPARRRAHQERHPLWESAGHRWTDEAALEAYLRRTRQAGHAELSVSEGKGLLLSAPVLSERGEFLAALGLAHHGPRPVSAKRRADLRARLLASAARLTSGEPPAPGA
jgi:DNA-binding IclR family transcriptional regulator